MSYTRRNRHSSSTDPDHNTENDERWQDYSNYHSNSGTSLKLYTNLRTSGDTLHYSWDDPCLCLVEKCASRILSVDFSSFSTIIPSHFQIIFTRGSHQSVFLHFSLGTVHLIDNRECYLVATFKNDRFLFLTWTNIDKIAFRWAWMVLCDRWIEFFEFGVIIIKVWTIPMLHNINPAQRTRLQVNITNLRYG